MWISHYEVDAVCFCTIMCPCKISVQQRSLDMGPPKWSAAINNVINSTCVFTSISCQNFVFIHWDVPVKPNQKFYTPVFDSNRPVWLMWWLKLKCLSYANMKILICSLTTSLLNIFQMCTNKCTHQYSMIHIICSLAQFKVTSMSCQTGSLEQSSLPDWIGQKCL